MSSATITGTREGRVRTALGAAYWLLKVVVSLAARYSGWAAVRSVSAISVAVQWFDPRVHFEGLRVRSVVAGRPAKGHDNAALLLIYCNGPLPPFTATFVEALGRSAFDLVVVSNGPLDAAARSYLLERSTLLIERSNVGRDFGGYKDGIAAIRRRYPRLRRLLLANDSVFYLPQGLDGLIDALNGSDEFVGVSEVFEHHYHVASFLLAFGQRVLESPAFRGFWRRYRPFNGRRWAILRGEGGLTKALMAAGFRPRVLYQTGALRERLQRYPVDNLFAEAETVPAATRRRLLQKWSGSYGAAMSCAAIATDIADAIGLRNQMHHGGLLFRRHLGLPVVKRDLVFRRIYPLQDVLAHLRDEDELLRRAIAADFRARPDPNDLGLWRRLLYRHGEF